MIFLVIWAHFFCDFVLQSDKMARGKSKSNKWLAIHIAVYTAPLMLFGWQFALVNGATHFVVDYFSSRASSYLWAKRDAHNFFVVIGADQAIHLSILVATMPLITFWGFQ